METMLIMGGGAAAVGLFGAICVWIGDNREKRCEKTA